MSGIVLPFSDRDRYRSHNHKLLRSSWNSFRSDGDKAETVKKRLDVYHEQTAPLIAHYKEAGSLHEIDGTQDIKVVFEEIKSILG